MGYKLRREVRDLLWPGALTASERVLLLELADNANDDTRVAYPGMEWILAACDLPTKKRAGEHLASIAAKWFEIRVEVGKDKNGNPLYALPRKRTTYRFPTRAELMARHGSGKVPENQGLDACKDPEKQGPKVPENQGGEPPKVPENQGPFSSSSSSPQRIPSSLSPREDDQPIAESVPAPQPERENDDASLKTTNTKPGRRHTILTAHGLTDNEHQHFAHWADQQPGGPKGDGWYIALNNNGTLTDRITDWRNSGQRASACPDCDGTGETGDWMNRRACHCLWWTNSGAARKAFIPQLKGMPPCEHGSEGGDIKAPNGWQHCAECRGPGWVDPDVKPRTEEKHTNSRYVPYQNPTDMDAYRDWSVLGRPSPGATVRPGGTRLRLTDSRADGRDYTEDF